jgi:hypothetical protein
MGCNSLFVENRFLFFTTKRRRQKIYCEGNGKIIPKKVLNGTFHNTRPVGRPRTRWADAVQRDALQLLGVRGWRRRAENRDEWRHALREAKARKGL